MSAEGRKVRDQALELETLVHFLPRIGKTQDENLGLRYLWSLQITNWLGCILWVK
jgi:hypothetical protein